MAAPIVVTAPPAAPRLLNLVTAARNPLQPSDETEGRWIHGLTYAPENTGTTGETSDPCSDAKDGNAWGNAETVTYEPIVVAAADKCSAFGWRARDYAGRALRLLDAVTPGRVENELWTGTIARAAGLPNRYLTDSQCVNVTPTAGPVGRIRGIELLEQALANCGYGPRGMIHMPPQDAGQLGQFVRRIGNLFLTPLDTIIVPGVGYPGTGPGNAAAAAGTTWMYATGIVDVRLSQPYLIPGTGPYGSDPIPAGALPDIPDSVLAQAMDRATNTVVFRAERFTAATWDGACSFGINVTTDV